MVLPTPSEFEAGRARRYLADYVEQTSRLTLHRWQRENLCPRLDEVGKKKGLRLIVHGPPQFGKSIVLTKRMPAQKLGQNPLLRIGITAYNVTHATRLAKATRNTLQSAEHKRIFPNRAGWIPEVCSAEEFSTFATLDLNEAQPSVAAYGLNSGFTGNGVDVLLVDDPYASPADAFSEAINGATWEWWDELASVRVNDETDVVCMFHRYHNKDLAGRLLATGDWDYLRFPAIADEDPDGTDPTRYWRGIGELLSPIRSQAFIDAQKKKNPRVFAGQFQGTPQDEEGALFTRDMFEIIDERPHLDMWLRTCDVASSVKEENDETATALVGIDSDKSLVVADVTAWKRAWPQSRDGRWEGRPYQDGSVCLEDGLIQLFQKDFEAIDEEAERHVYDERATYLIGIATKGMGLPIFQDLEQNDLIDGLPLFPVDERGDKKQRAAVWAARGHTRPIRLVRSSWNEWFIQLCLAFRGDGTSDDDPIDAVSLAMILLRMYKGGKLEKKRIPKRGTTDYYDALSAANG